MPRLILAPLFLCDPSELWGLAACRCKAASLSLSLSSSVHTSCAFAALATPDCSRLLVCFTAMHSFWQPCFTMLHELVIDSLADVHLVGALPLLGVNQHLRQLVIKRLVAAYSKAAQVAARSKRPLVPFAGDREFVSVSPPRCLLRSTGPCLFSDASDASVEPWIQIWLNGVAPQEGPHKEDDPRYILAQARKRDRSESDATDFVL